jgi:hypothetical protein
LCRKWLNVSAAEATAPQKPSGFFFAISAFALLSFPASICQNTAIQLGKLIESYTMTPFEFGVKVAEAVGAAPAIKPAAPIKPPAPQAIKPVVPQTGPRPITMDRVRAADAAARAKGYAGSVMGAFVSDGWEFHSQPSQAMQDMKARDQAELTRRQNTPYTPPPQDPEITRMKGNFAKLHPQFHPGEIQDMAQLVTQNRGGDLAQFINNTRQRIKQHPTSAYNYKPPAQ